MTATFFIAAAGMTRVSLLLVVSPLLRLRFVEPKLSTPIRYSAFAITVLMPLSAFGLYRWCGAPPSLQTHMSLTATPTALANSSAEPIRLEIARVVE